MPLTIIRKKNKTIKTAIIITIVKPIISAKANSKKKTLCGSIQSLAKLSNGN